MTTIIRRAALCGIASIPASAAAAATLVSSEAPALAAAPEPAPMPPEHPWERARRLCDELSATLAECAGGRWYAEVLPAGRNGPVSRFVQTKPFEGPVDYHSRALLEALKRDYPGRWTLNYGDLTELDRDGGYFMSFMNQGRVRGLS